MEPLCRHAMRYLLLTKSQSDVILKILKLRYGAIDVWQNVQQLHGAKIHIFDNDTSGEIRSI